MRKIGLLVIVHCLFLTFQCFCFAEDLPTFQGNEVVVTAARHPQPMGESPWSVTVLSSEALEATGARRLGDALRSVISMDIKSNGYEGAVTSMRLRGSNAEHILVLVDGVRVSSALMGLTDFADIPIEDIDRVEIVRGASSAIYGADAVSGVVNIIKKKPSGAFENSVSALYGTYGTAQLSFLVSGRTDFDYLFSASYDKSDGFRTNSDYSAQNYSATLKWRTLEDEIVTLGLGAYAADKGIPGVPTSEDRPHSASTPYDRQRDNNANFSLKYEKAVEDNSDLELMAYQSQSNQRSHRYDFWGTQDFVDDRYLSYTNGVEIKNLVDLSEREKLTTGLDWREEIGRSDGAGSHSINNIALYFQDESSYSNNLFLNVGARGDAHSQSGDFISSRVGMLYKMLPSLHLRGSFGSSFRSPTLNELYYYDPNPFYPSYGDKDLSPEKALVFDMGLINTFEGGARLDIGYFTETINDMIFWNYDPSTNITRVSNLFKVDIQGFELTFSRELANWIRYSFNITYQNPVLTRDRREDDFSGKDLVYCPRTKGNAQLSFNDEAGLNYNIIGKFVGDRFVDNANSVVIPNYFIWDLKLWREREGVTWSLGVENVFDAVYFESAGTHPLTGELLDYPMPGRRFVFGVKYGI